MQSSSPEPPFPSFNTPVVTTTAVIRAEITNEVFLFDFFSIQNILLRQHK